MGETKNYGEAIFGEIIKVRSYFSRSNMSTKAEKVEQTPRFSDVEKQNFKDDQILKGASEKCRTPK